MNEIPMLDLEGQHGPLRADLEAAACRVLRSGCFIQGSEVAAFEAEMARALGLSFAVGLSSGTDALLAMLTACGVGPGDQVVTTPFTFFATTEAIVRLGAKPVFADLDRDTLNLDPAAAAARIGGRTKAVLVVHLFGRVARTGPLETACASAGVPLLEDGAQAVGAWREEGGTRRTVGAIGRGAALSFFPAKNLGGFGDAGMVITNDASFASQLRVLRVHGASSKSRHDTVGGNFRLDELQAALLRVKLPHLSSWTAERRRLAAAYRERLAGLAVQPPPDEEGCVWNQYVIRAPAAARDALARHLSARGIATAVHYPWPIHLQPALAAFGGRRGDFPIAEKAAQEVLALPIYPGLGEERLSRVADAVADFFR